MIYILVSLAWIDVISILLVSFFNYMLLTSFPVKSAYSSIDKKNSFFIHRIIFQIIYFCKKLFFILLTLTTLFFIFYFWI